MELIVMFSVILKVIMKTNIFIVDYTLVSPK